MKSQLSLKWALLVIVSGVLVLALNPNLFQKPTKSVVQTASVVEAVSRPKIVSKASLQKIPTTFQATAKTSFQNSNVPTRLKIPSIGVDAQIESLGLTKGGAMDAPVGPSNAGWYNLGPKPGEIGSAVMDGHFGWKNHIPAVFDNLSKLKKGDTIQVVDGNGVTTTFIVRETKILSADADATQVFTSSDNKSHLNLITCNGKWDTTTKNRPSRLIVFADKAV